VVGRVVDVRPVEKCCHTGVDRLERAEEVAGVHVLRAVGRRQGVEDQREVPVERNVRRYAADHGLPGVPMRVDKARNDDRARGVDDFGVGRVDGRSNRRDILALDEHIAARDVPYVWIHRDDVATAEQGSCKHLCS
jgi:hypothetical protein